MVVQSRPVLRRATVANGFFSFTIGNCPTGATNYVERSMGPDGQGGWQDVFNFLTPFSDTNWTDPEEAQSPNFFYRVKSVVGAAVSSSSSHGP